MRAGEGEIKNPEFLVRNRGYIINRTTPECFVVAMQGLEPRTPRI